MIRIVIMAAILICVNVLASYFHKGLDLTKENRFTLSPSTKTLLNNMQEVAVVEVYLKGKFPAQLQRLQEAVRERLMSFKDIAGNHIIFRFIDPFEGKTDAEQKQIAHDLANKGIRFLQLSTGDEQDFSMKVFFPYALVHYNGKEVPIMLLEDPPGKTPAEKISAAEATLEYKFATAINLLSQPTRSRVAYMVGNGEELGINTYDMLTSISRYYDLDTVDLAHITHIPMAYDAILIVKPTTPFSVAQKVRIDQYVMRGGHVLWAINNLNATTDSLRSGAMVAMEYGLELDDMLFKYGVRINNDVVQDMQCVQLGRMSRDGGMELKNWPYFPKLNPTSDHPIVRNMDFILGGFTNSMDTIKSSGISKTVLLTTSKYCLKAAAPVRISMSVMNYPLQHEIYTKSYLPVAVLMEGKFHSTYENILAPASIKFLDSINQPFKPVCDSSNKMIVTSVGDVFMNDYSTKDGVLQMGYYKWTGEFFQNRSFMLNCLEYLTSNAGILESRSKEVKLRMLDYGRAKDEKTQWQFVNVAVPIAAVFIFASCYFFFRKRRYEIKVQPKS